ncbi:MAG: hypothetical protein WCG27_01960 [Pseudomonadota bacterium]
MFSEIKKLTNKQLLAQTELAVKKEKELTSIVLKHLLEIEHRRLFCELGYSSLFAYCVFHLKYSESETKIRITAMRFMRGSPMIEKAIADGKVTLTTASLLGGHCQRQKKETGIPVTLLAKEKLVEELQNKSTREVERHLFSGDQSPKKKIELDGETLELLDQLRQLKGSFSDSELIKLALKKTIQATKEENQKRVEKVKKASLTDKGEAVKSSSPQRPSRYIPQKTKDQIWARAQGQCEFKSADGRRCSEKRGLEYHHCRPFAWGALPEIDGLSLYCKSHNQFAAIKDFGQQKMDFYLNR